VDSVESILELEVAVETVPVDCTGYTDWNPAWTEAARRSDPMKRTVHTLRRSCEESTRKKDPPQSRRLAEKQLDAFEQ
jgi:hypothetical protein